jgi:hypothetical protein
LDAHPRPDDLADMLPEYQALQQRQPDLPGLAEALALLRRAANATGEER